jgi:hypothetical protein
MGFVVMKSRLFLAALDILYRDLLPRDTFPRYPEAASGTVRYQQSMGAQAAPPSWGRIYSGYMAEGVRDASGVQGVTDVLYFKVMVVA